MPEPADDVRHLRRPAIRRLAGQRSLRGDEVSRSEVVCQLPGGGFLVPAGFPISEEVTEASGVRFILAVDAAGAATA